MRIRWNQAKKKILFHRCLLVTTLDNCMQIKVEALGHQKQTCLQVLNSFIIFYHCLKLVEKISGNWIGLHFWKGVQSAGWSIWLCWAATSMYCGLPSSARTWAWQRKCIPSWNETLPRFPFRMQADSCLLYSSLYLVPRKSNFFDFFKGQRSCVVWWRKLHVLCGSILSMVQESSKGRGLLQMMENRPLHAMLLQKKKTMAAKNNKKTK